MLGGLGLVLLIAAQEEESAVDLRDEGLHAAVHHLGEPGVVGDLPDRDAGGGDRLGSAAGGEELDPHLVEAAGEVDESGLVRDGEKGALDFHARSVSAVSVKEGLRKTAQQSRASWWNWRR